MAMSRPETEQHAAIAAMAALVQSGKYEDDPDAIADVAYIAHRYALALVEELFDD